MLGFYRHDYGRGAEFGRPTTDVGGWLRSLDLRHRENANRGKLARDDRVMERNADFQLKTSH
jgi:hypothetical protein